MKYLTMALLGSLLIGGAAPAVAQDPDVMKIGLVDSLLRDLTPGKRKLLDTEFPDLVKDFTGFNSMVMQGVDPFTAGKKLAAGEWHLGVLQGVEFAWAQSKDKKLTPLTVAVTKPKSLQALLVAAKDGKISSFEDLKDKEVHVLSGREHCRLYAEKSGGEKAGVKLLPTSNTEEALDNILRGKVQASIVDSAALESYEELQPGRFKRLKVAMKSETFPPTVIAHYQGALSQQLLNKFRDGMLMANQSEKGREAMAGFRIASFETVPADYQRQLDEILKAYPPPTK